MKKLFVTERELAAFRLRYNSGWKLRRIARHLGVSTSAISQRLSRLEKRVGPGVIPSRIRQRRVRAVSLSDVHNV